MSKAYRAGLALAGALALSPLQSMSAAESVVVYDPGVGFAAGYTNTSAVLGLPNRDTAFGAVQPFNPPFDRSEILSMGTNGSLTVGFASPVRHDSANLYGIDFIIYGSSGFVDVDYPNGRTDSSASAFGNNSGMTRVRVSADNVTFYTLNPAIALVVDSMFPTDGAGNFGVPVNPMLTQTSFANKTLGEIRALYAGSAGGAGYDLTWAQDAGGNPVALDSIRYVRIDVLSGRAEIDAVLPVSAGGGTTFTENFASSPFGSGWRTWGDSLLFAWSTNGNLEVTWDSRRPNSLFYRPLGTVLSKAEDFNFGFDLRLRDIAYGVDTNKPYTFEIAVGLCRFNSITNANFFRGSGVNANSGPRNLVEFDYFPDSGFGATIAPTVVSTNNRIRASHNFPLELTTNDLFHVRMCYTASNQLLRTEITRNGTAFGPIQNLSLTNFDDFRVDTFAVISYNDGQQSPPEFSGSVLAHGTIDDISWTVPTASLLALSSGWGPTSFRADFYGMSNWVYRLERTGDFQQWSYVTEAVARDNGPVRLRDTEPSPDRGFYRVTADRR